MSLLLLLGFLVGGGLLGWWLKDRPRVGLINRQATRIALWALLFAMGTKLALNRALFAKDARIFLMAVLSSAFLTAAYFAGFWLWKVLRKAPPALGSHVEPGAEGASGHEWLSVALNGGCIAGGALLFVVLPGPWTAAVPVDRLSEGLLWVLLACIGLDLGTELHHLDLRKLAPHLLWVPLANILATLGIGLVYALLVRLTVREGLLLVSGLGWYSLSSVLLSQQGLVLLSILAFIHNVFRELFAILTAPLAARLSPYLPVYLGGATSMDVMLPFVQRYAGREYTLVSFYSGVVCSVAVVPLVRLLVG